MHPLALRLLFALLAPSLVAAPASSQTAITARELASYTLTIETFRQFEQASRLIGEATASDARFRYAPLFTREVAVSGDAPEVAAQLIARLENNPPLVAALAEAGMSARDYAQFALSLFAARMAHGFLESGVLRRVPAGTATDNVAFVAAHAAEITAVLMALGVEG